MSRHRTSRTRFTWSFAAEASYFTTARGTHSSQATFFSWPPRSSIDSKTTAMTSLCGVFSTAPMEARSRHRSGQLAVKMTRCSSCRTRHWNGPALPAAHWRPLEASGGVVSPHGRLAVIATFGVLGCCYGASLAATVIIVGPSRFTDAVFRVPDFVVLFVAAAVEAVGCFVLAVLSFGSRQSAAGCLGLAVILAVGG